MSSELDIFEEVERISARRSLIRFLTESLMIEGIHREPTQEEITATEAFLKRKQMTVDAVCRLQAVYAPGMPLRDQPGMNVSVGNYVAPPGGPDIESLLTTVCRWVSEGRNNPWASHVDFEKVHPFMDGNGRTGRALWAWHMKKLGRDPFALSFLHHWYYQTLENSEIKI